MENAITTAQDQAFGPGKAPSKANARVQSILALSFNGEVITGPDDAGWNGTGEIGCDHKTSERTRRRWIGIHFAGVHSRSLPVSIAEIAQAIIAEA